MDIEFHYYITYLIALRGGFTSDEAYVIAYSSQYVDDNTRQYKINQGTADAYTNYISQTSDITKPEKDLMRIYPIFHFMPGDKQEIECDGALRRDGKFHVLNTIPDNCNARASLKAAFESKDLYRIGIATHMFADTFAHQNFVGYYESFNSMKGLLEKAIPDVGHADAKHNPDWPALKWEDKRLIRGHASVDNKERFLAAAERILEEYCRFRDLSCEASVLEQKKKALREEIDKAIGDHDESNREQRNRIARFKKLIGDEFKEYDENDWLNESVKKGFLAPFNRWADSRWKPNHEESQWYRFQEAVRNHQWFTNDEILVPLTAHLELERM